MNTHSLVTADVDTTNAKSTTVKSATVKSTMRKPQFSLPDPTCWSFGDRAGAGVSGAIARRS